MHTPLAPCEEYSNPNKERSVREVKQKGRPNHKAEQSHHYHGGAGDLPFVSHDYGTNKLRPMVKALPKKKRKKKSQILEVEKPKSVLSLITRVGSMARNCKLQTPLHSRVRITRRTERS